VKQRLQILDLPVDRIESALVAVPYFTDQRPLEGPAALLDWRLDGLLTDQLVQGDAHGNPGDRYLVKANHKVSAEWVMFVGCGHLSKQDKGSAAKVVAEMLASVGQAGFSQFAIGLPVESRERIPFWQDVIESALDQPDTRGFECQLASCDPSAYRD